MSNNFKMHNYGKKAWRYKYTYGYILTNMLLVYNQLTILDYANVYLLEVYTTMIFSVINRFF